MANHGVDVIFFDMKIANKKSHLTFLDKTQNFFKSINMFVRKFE